MLEQTGCFLIMNWTCFDCAFFFEHNFEMAYFKMVDLSMLTMITQLTMKRIFPQIFLNILSPSSASISITFSKRLYISLYIITFECFINNKLDMFILCLMVWDKNKFFFFLKIKKVNYFLYFSITFIRGKKNRPKAVA